MRGNHALLPRNGPFGKNHHRSSLTYIGQCLLQSCSIALAAMYRNLSGQLSEPARNGPLEDLNLREKPDPAWQKRSQQERIVPAKMIGNEQERSIFGHMLQSADLIAADEARKYPGKAI